MKRRKSVDTSQVSVFLGSDSSLEGVIDFQGLARLDGKFSGEVRGHGTLVIGPRAEIKATISATNIEISGKVVGDIVADDRIALHTPADVVGNITAPLVVMDEGVKFDGNCRMAGDAAATGTKAGVRLLTPDTKVSA